MKQAAICTIGDEILIGQIIDTNSSRIAQELNSIGVKVAHMSSISDDNADIKASLDRLLRLYDIVITTGGLGPTKDDITKKALGELFSSEGYYDHPGQWAVVKRVLLSRGIEITDSNRAQSFVPIGCEVIVNHLGTAPCMVFRFPKEKYPNTPTLYSLPGVPFEAIGMLENVIMDIKRHHLLEDIHHKTIVTFGIPESTLAKTIESWEDALPKDIKLAYLPNPIVGVKLRLSIYGGEKSDEIKRIDSEFEKLKPYIGNAIYGEGKDTLPIVIGRTLASRNQTLSVAESCTGGLIASLLTAVPGASKYFYGSVTSYDNSIKKNVLGVPEEILNEKGAVSRECAEAMAMGVKRLMNTDFSIATTGIAGPDGGTRDKPVGTVWMAVAFTDPQTGKETVISEMRQFASDREHNIQRFASYALNLLRLNIISEAK